MTITFGSIALATRQNVTVIAGQENPLNIRQVGKPKKKSDGGLLSSTGNFLNGILGNVLNLVNNISWQSVAAWIVGGAQFIFNFNWQTSDLDSAKF